MTDDERAQLSRTLTELRITVHEGFSALRERMDSIKDHEPRLRALEQAAERAVTRDEVSEFVDRAVESGRRPTWQGIAALVGAVAAGSGLMSGIVVAVMHLWPAV